MNLPCEQPLSPPARAACAAARPLCDAPASALYECRVLHERFSPRAHRFAYRLFYLHLDLDELDALHKGLRLFSVNRPNVFSFRDRDFLPVGEPLHGASSFSRQLRFGVPDGGGTLKARVLAFCAAHGLDLGAGARVELVTLPRLLGYRFNPVSFYFCFGRDGAPRAAIAEVTNTFHEMKPYFIPLHRAGAKPVFRLRVPKHFYVSPFSSVEVEFDFHLHAPGAKLAVRIDDFAAGHRVLHTTLTGGRVPITDARLAWFLVKYPLATLGVAARIHWHALRLWLKRVPYFRKADAAERQRDLYRPDLSIAERPSP